MVWYGTWTRACFVVLVVVATYQDSGSHGIFIRSGVSGPNHGSPSRVLVHAVDDKGNGDR